MQIDDTINPIEAEKRLATAVETEDEALIARTLAGIGRDALEFTGRCYAMAITRGLADTAVLFGRAGFCLNIMDEPAVQAELAANGGQTRGLVDFMQRYRYCRAQRTYYLPVVQEPASRGPIDALLQAGIGLSERDCSELLSLAIRQDNVELARVLVNGGAHLADDIHEAAPDDLAGKMSLEAAANPWIDQLSPRSGLETIAFVLEQLGDARCPIRTDWFKLYFRDPRFSEKLALIAPHATTATCEDASALLAELARGGHVRAVRAVLAWEDLDPSACDEALDIAREKGHVEIAAALLEAQRTDTSKLAPLTF